mmetsp:Transcript_24293/g.45966  ORF Transcript_24293/g.45966 Transcript_24293/m.45966 type:complete len:181 (+) Transcript_24293:116-658(+)
MWMVRWRALWSAVAAALVQESQAQEALVVQTDGSVQRAEEKQPSYSATYQPNPAKTDSDEDGIGSEDTVKPIPISPTLRRDWTTQGDYKLGPSPTQREKTKFSFKQVDCSKMAHVSHCGKLDQPGCAGTFEINGGVGYTCLWDTQIWPPACMTYRNKARTPLCTEGTCGPGTRGAPDKCW